MDHAYSQLSDLELAGLLKSGDQSAFAQIYERYWRVIYGHVYKMLLDEEEAKDVIQEVFSEIWIKREQHYSNLAGYLYVSARHKVINLVRKTKFHSAYLDSLSRFANGISTATLEQLDEKDLAAAIEREIQGLPPRMKEIFELSRKENLSYKEIAGRLGISDKTVKKQMHKSLQQIRLNLKDSGAVAIVLLAWIR
ncbi:RNA polymerase sigma factor [Chitinophaga sp. GCM10012297]|uniref:RNA polymerase sigma-70 factor n=1 Tax=Chitinophaga chungangae TaxID=2821488 RepID=A0ABS3YFI0_9BACT|nr:RNA polymerase sigma-70 factor [Chitinophaga chungangae]MBO9153447.1 RNA polymerase sigma-70 factor [Chitinophaga chungangae]